MIQAVRIVIGGALIIGVVLTGLVVTPPSPVHGEDRQAGRSAMTGAAVASPEDSMAYPVERRVSGPPG